MAYTKHTPSSFRSLCRHFSPILHSAHSLTTTSPSSRPTPLSCCAHSIHTAQTPCHYFCPCAVQSIDGALFFSRDTHTLISVHTPVHGAMHTPLQLRTICSHGALSLLTVYSALPHDNILSTPLLLPCNFILQTCKLIQ